MGRSPTEFLGGNPPPDGFTHQMTRAGRVVGRAGRSGALGTGWVGVSERVGGVSGRVGGAVVGGGAFGGFTHEVGGSPIACGGGTHTLVG